ncbi:GH25 family lysozyme [Nonomuraea sediminis]|uniref:GH25 family lysozyme n=1 Tax=Nonomuraea sediminis TaxID=2835864 RepID=UPI0027E029F1|nr:GH25 family lysozyme [Nonomuraea sediminis]
MTALVGLSGSAQAADGLAGVDVSNWTGEVDWDSVSSGGAKFAFVQATEGTNYRNPSFDAQYGGAANAGLLRGAYHLAQPHESDGATQADFFLQNGGSWTGGGQTLPGVLDLEDNPYRDKNGKNTCYDLSPKDMVTWIKDFTTKYRQVTGVRTIIYTTTSWWRTCTGDSAKFAANPLWLAHWGNEPGELPKSWQQHTFWQSAEKGPLAGGQDSFNGTDAELGTLANPPAEVTVSGAARDRRHYTVTVTNTGPYPVTNVKISGRAYGGQHVTRAPGCTFSGTAVRCTIPELARGRKATFTFTTKAKPKGPVGMRFTVGSVELTLSAR